MSSAASKDCVQVALRIRPLIPKEVRDKCKKGISVVGENQVRQDRRFIEKKDDKRFAYDKVFEEDSTQLECYDSVVAPLVNAYTQGYNATVLAYGQTGSGKTFTMGTSFTRSLKEKDLGIVPRVIMELFNTIKEREDTDFEVRVSFLEIYNENIIDLLRDPNATDAKDHHNVPAIRETGPDQITVTNVERKQCFNYDDMMSMLEMGTTNRTTASTNMNETSSRSHAIFTIFLTQSRKMTEDEESKEEAEDLNTSAADEQMYEDVLQSKFHFVDLAGSERLKKTGAEGDRMREGISINSGLLALGNVISALAERSAKKRVHVPFRDSKITRLLQDSLGGNSKTLMIACVSPADYNTEETYSTLQYAWRAKKIKNRPIINRDPQSELIARLRARIRELEGKLTMAGISSDFDMHPGTVRLVDKQNYTILQEKISIMEPEITRLNKRVVEFRRQSEKLRQQRDDYSERLEKLGEQVNRDADDVAVEDAIRSPKPRSGVSRNNSQSLSNTTSLSPVDPHSSVAVTDREADAGAESKHEAAGSDSEEEDDEDSDHLAFDAKDPESVEAYQKMTELRMREEAHNLETMRRKHDNIVEDISSKEKLMQELARERENGSNMMRHLQQCEVKIVELENKISETRVQQDNAVRKLGSNGKKMDSKTREKIVKPFAEKIKSLNEKLRSFREKAKGYSRMKSQNAQYTRRIVKLQQEIEARNKAKVALMNKMRAQKKKQQQLLEERTKVAQRAKRELQRKSYLMQKMQAQYSKEKSAMQQKLEKARAVEARKRRNRRLGFNRRRSVNVNNKTALSSEDPRERQAAKRRLMKRSRNLSGLTSGPGVKSYKRLKNAVNAEMRGIVSKLEEEAQLKEQVKDLEAERRNYLQEATDALQRIKSDFTLDKSSRKVLEDQHARKTSKAQAAAVKIEQRKASLAKVREELGNAETADDVNATMDITSLVGDDMFERLSIERLDHARGIISELMRQFIDSRMKKYMLAQFNAELEYEVAELKAKLSNTEDKLQQETKATAAYRDEMSKSVQELMGSDGAGWVPSGSLSREPNTALSPAAPLNDVKTSPGKESPSDARLNELDSRLAELTIARAQDRQSQAERRAAAVALLGNGDTNTNKPESSKRRSSRRSSRRVGGKRGPILAHVSLVSGGSEGKPKVNADANDDDSRISSAGNTDKENNDQSSQAGNTEVGRAAKLQQNLLATPAPFSPDSRREYTPTSDQSSYSATPSPSVPPTSPFRISKQASASSPDSNQVWNAWKEVFGRKASGVAGQNLGITSPPAESGEQ